MPKRLSLTGVLLLPLLLLTACDAPGGDADGDGLVARAAGHTLTTSRMTDLLETRGQLPDAEGLVRAVADLWIDYTLLAEAAAGDPSLESLDLSSVVDGQLEQELILSFRDSVVEVDTVFSDEELQTEFAQRGSGVQIHARHILLSLPDGASDAERDSVESLASELQRRAEDGESFADLALEHSDDPGSASRGGDLGTFGRGTMVPAFEEAAFALDSGEVSEPVESPYGLHVIKLENRVTPEFEERREAFAEELRSRRIFEAESTYVAGIEDAANVRVVEDNYDVVRSLAARPETNLSSRASRRPVVEYEGGTITASDFRHFIRARSPQERGQIENAPPAQLETILRNLARRELILSAARDAGMQIPQDRRSELSGEIRNSLGQVIDQLGLGDVSPAEGESRTEAIDRRVQALLEETLSGRRNVLPLGALAYALREEMGGEVYEGGVQLVVDTLERRAADTTDAGDPSSGTAPPRSSPATPPPAGSGDGTR